MSTTSREKGWPRRRCATRQQHPEIEIAIARGRGRISDEQRVRLIGLWYEHNEDASAVMKIWRDERPVDSSACSSVRTLRSLVNRFREFGSVKDRPRSGRKRSARTDDAIARVSESIAQEPTLSTRKRADLLGISRSSLMRIQKTDIGARAYKMQSAHHMLPLDKPARLRFSRRFLRAIRRDANMVHRMIMGDEAHFDLFGGVFNRQNVRYWGTSNPRLWRPNVQHPVRVTVWCGVSSAGVLGPYFFENVDTGTTESVTGERYRRMLIDYVRPLLATSPYRRVKNWWWQQDGATAHTARATMNVLRDTFGADRLLSRGARFPWPPRSPDLSPPDFFLWGYLKDRVYGGKIIATAAATDGAIADGDGTVAAAANENNEARFVDSPRTIAELKDAIVREVGALNTSENDSLRRSVMVSVVNRAKECERANGGHLIDRIFHK